ncbi:hypothetical protein L9F63_009208, partial [Diploptera punctata]
GITFHNHSASGKLIRISPVMVHREHAFPTILIFTLISFMICTCRITECL